MRATRVVLICVIGLSLTGCGLFRKKGPAATSPVATVSGPSVESHMEVAPEVGVDTGGGAAAVETATETDTTTDAVRPESELLSRLETLEAEVVAVTQSVEANKHDLIQQQSTSANIAEKVGEIENLTQSNYQLDAQRAQVETKKVEAELEESKAQIASKERTNFFLMIGYAPFALIAIGICTIAWAMDGFPGKQKWIAMGIGAGFVVAGIVLTLKILSAASAAGVMGG